MGLPAVQHRFFSRNVLCFSPVFFSEEKQDAGMQEGPVLSGRKGIRDSWKSILLLPKCNVNASVDEPRLIIQTKIAQVQVSRKL